MQDFTTTIDNIIFVLMRDGINSKRVVIDRLSNLTKEDLHNLMRDIKIRLATENYSTKE